MGGLHGPLKGRHLRRSFLRKERFRLRLQRSRWSSAAPAALWCTAVGCSSACLCVHDVGQRLSAGLASERSSQSSPDAGELHFRNGVRQGSSHGQSGQAADLKSRTGSLVSGAQYASLESTSLASDRK